MLVLESKSWRAVSTVSDRGRTSSRGLKLRGGVHFRADLWRGTVPLFLPSSGCEGGGWGERRGSGGHGSGEDAAS